MAVRITKEEWKRLTGAAAPAPIPTVKASMVPTDSPCGTYTVEIPGWRPATVNELMHSVRARSALKKRDRKWVGDFLGTQDRVPLATRKRRVHVTVAYGPGERSVDVDAHHKSLLDALKHHGFIVNDSPRWCEITPVRYERGSPRTVITLEDVP